MGKASNIVQLQLVPPIEKPKRPPNKRRLSENWRPSEANIAYAVSKGLTDKEAFAQAELFLNYWLGCGKTMANWDRVWMTWCINATTRYAGRRRPNDKPYSPII